MFRFLSLFFSRGMTTLHDIFQRGESAAVRLIRGKRSTQDQSNPVEYESIQLAKLQNKEVQTSLSKVKFTFQILFLLIDALI